MQERCNDVEALSVQSGCHNFLLPYDMCAMICCDVLSCLTYWPWDGTSHFPKVLQFLVYVGRFGNKNWWCGSISEVQRAAIVLPIQNQLFFFFSWSQQDLQMQAKLKTEWGGGEIFAAMQKWTIYACAEGRLEYGTARQKKKKQRISSVICIWASPPPLASSPPAWTSLQK